MTPPGGSSEFQPDAGRTKARPPKGVITRNLKLLGVGLLAWSLYYAFTDSPAVALAPSLWSVAGLLLSFRLQPRPGDDVEPQARLGGKARALTVAGSLLTVAGSIPIVFGALLMAWNALQMAIGGTSYTPLSWAAVLTIMAGAWLLSVIGWWVVDQGQAIARIQAEPSASPDRPRE